MKLLRLALAVLGLAAFAGVALAHPPVRVDLSYDGSKLNVTVVHPVSDPARHYVSRISVFVGGKLVQQREYREQSGADGLHDVIPLGGIASGSEIKVVAACSIMGTASGVLVVP